MLLTLLVLASALFLAAFPRWSYSRQWGYAPSGTLGFVALALGVQLLLGVAG